jgi:hypothetical protein
VKKLMLIFAIVIMVGQAHATEFDYKKLKSAIAYVESGNGVYYRYEPKIYKKYLKGKSKWEALIVQYGLEDISASHGKYQILYSTAHQYGFRGSPQLLGYDVVQDKLFDKIFKRLLKKAHGDSERAIMAWNTGSPKVPSYKYLEKVKKAYKEGR